MHTTKKQQPGHPILIQQSIHKEGKTRSFFNLCFAFSIFCCLTLISSGCSINNSAVEYLSAADLRLDSARAYGADQLAEAEFEEAEALYAEGELALQKKDKEALSIAQKALAKARLAEALARQAGVLRVVINGSFVTDVLEPNDVDCVLLIDDEFPRNEQSEVELRSGLPFLEVQLVTADAFELLVESIFATDRRMRPKGMVEVLL